MHTTIHIAYTACLVSSERISLHIIYVISYHVSEKGMRQQVLLRWCIQPRTYLFDSAAGLGCHAADTCYNTPLFHVIQTWS